MILPCLLTAILAAPPHPSTDLSIIPAPVELTPAAGEFVISPQTIVAAAPGPASREAEKLIDAVAPALGFRLRTSTGAVDAFNTISLELDPALPDAGDEGYRLEVRPDRIVIQAAQPAGLYYGTQTLRQLMPSAVFRKAPVTGVRWSVPCVVIRDRPRFAWRGLLLDPARHFIPRSAVLQMIDAMALHKLNSLQLHLTDDQGWRIEIKKYPRLTEVGAWRKETLIGHLGHQPPRYDGKRHGGYYTQDDIREIVAYAAERYITVVPEIEMPGHARAAIAAYPELGCHPDQRLEPWTTWGICPDIFVPTDHTVAFLQDVLSEVLELFPSKFIHVGGDEAIKDQWKASDVVQVRIKELGLAGEHELQSWFIRQMDRFLAERGRRLIGWDDILDGGLAPAATVMSWRGEQTAITAARAGHDVVMASVTHTYLDYYQADPALEPLAIGGLILLENVYHWEPVPKELASEQRRHILGGQAQLWSEYLPDIRHTQYMAFPRTAALAEVLWSPSDQRDYDRFLARLRPHLERLDAMDVNYRAMK